MTQATPTQVRSMPSCVKQESLRSDWHLAHTHRPVRDACMHPNHGRVNEHTQLCTRS